MTKKEEVSQPTELTLNPSLTTAWIDSIHFGLRDDNLCLIRFLTNLPEGSVEQSRIMTSNEHLKGFIDIICQALDYSPSKTKKNKK